MGNRDDLLAGAKRCLREKGYDRTSVRDIATAAGVSTAAIGYHYGSRETLLTQALFELLDEWGDSLGRALAPGSGDDAGTGFRRMWEGLIAQFRDHPDLWLATVELFLQAQRQPELSARLSDGVAEGWRGMAAILGSEPEDAVSDRSARTLGMMQTALMTGVMIQSLSDPAHAPTADEVLEGLGALGRLAEPAPPS
ncbi:TetR/AcrR family transcriptional regulator [Streptomyces tubbatahanensis]|uniref:TetR/AcrR family transcriptional regulator n=1 Tax=Streptomyces tubbatahanensis TaxID=2923272 RepID=A0ABY3XUW8_9ACTN|nr:TetR/AcrR family transcriptional regulator [Streptomyces tubbatahanensis]UNS98106.1 TetR/AcrR family transcriptional regulator [Streptomyces tubbatahanensis]